MLTYVHYELNDVRQTDIPTWSVYSLHWNGNGVVAVGVRRKFVYFWQQVFNYKI